MNRNRTMPCTTVVLRLPAYQSIITNAMLSISSFQSYVHDPIFASSLLAFESMAWAALAGKTQVHATKLQDRWHHADGSQYPPVAAVLNDTFFISFAVAIVDTGSQQLCLVRETPDAPLYLVEGDLEPDEHSLEISIINACVRQVCRPSASKCMRHSHVH